MNESPLHSHDASDTAIRPWALVLAGGAVMGLALGMRHVQGLFLLPITLDRGWSRETFGLAMALQNLTWGAAQPFAGMVADRFGTAKVVAAGLALHALGLFCMAHATTPAGFVWSAGVCIGIAQSGTTFGVIYGVLNRTLATERRGWALGLAGAVGGLGQFAMVPTAQRLLGAWGWGSALLVLAAVMAVALPLALPLREKLARPERVQQISMAAAIREALRHRGFWLLNLGFLACGFQLAFVATHLPAYLLDKGLRASDAVAALAIIALANIFGTYCFGLLGANFRRKYLLAGVYLARTSAMALFFQFPVSPLSVHLFAAVMGFLWLGTVPLTNGLLSQVFGVRYIGTLFGFVFLGHQLGSFLGVWLGGLVFEATRSYDLVWLCAIGLGVVAAVLHFPIDDRQLRRAPPRRWPHDIAARAVAARGRAGAAGRGLVARLVRRRRCGLLAAAAVVLRLRPCGRIDENRSGPKMAMPCRSMEVFPWSMAQTDY